MLWSQRPKECIQKITATNEKEAIYSDNPSLIGLAIADQNAPKAVLTMMIGNVVSFLNVGKTMDAPQVIETVNLILTDPILKCLKPDDIKVCFDRAKRGQYGKQYDRIDGQVICSWLYEYASARQDEYERLAIKHHSTRDMREKDKPANPEGQKKVIEILSQFAEKQEVKKKQEVIKNSREKYIQKCFMAFYRLWKRKPFGDPDKTRFVERNGKVMTEEEYVQYRLSKYDRFNAA